MLAFTFVKHNNAEMQYMYMNLVDNETTKPKLSYNLNVLILDDVFV